ncbi:Nicotinamidase [Cladobotryum mycophilum]|uniref:nicotinamidase n=1 Tax=Cladobotryum mycophilum TaxID=491253 RepID=A0ABR0S4I2_9HYPO
MMKTILRGGFVAAACVVAMASAFKPALIVVDFQEDFCPSNGSLAVPGGRDIAPIVNALLDLPFALKIATRDWHPRDHVSFAANHPGAAPFTSNYTIVNPADAAENYTTTLWPVHCVQGSSGAQLVPELNLREVDAVIDKGMNPTVEMYSAFYDPFRISDSGLAGMLHAAGITDVYVVGLAFDYCVKATAEHALGEGFGTYVVGEGTRAVDPGRWEGVRGSWRRLG